MPIALADIQGDQDASSDVRSNNGDIWEDFIAQLEACRAGLSTLKDGMLAITNLVEEMERVTANIESRIDNMDLIVTARALAENHPDHDISANTTILD